jgi:hypothetical protein
MAVYGPGDSSLDHTDHEHIDLGEYAESITVLTNAVQALAATVAGRLACAGQPAVQAGGEGQAARLVPRPRADAQVARDLLGHRATP